MLIHFCVDPTLGKVEKFTLPQDTLMELLTSDISNRSRICTNSDDPDNFQWIGVTPGLKDEIVTIWWYKKNLKGSIHLEWLPLTLVLVKMSVNRLAGTICLTSLPEKLEELIISVNNLTGSLHLERLPPALKNLSLDDNHFEGSVVLECLPKRLERLDLHSNDLSGSVNLTRLPPVIRYLNLSKNGFVGETDFSQLPMSLIGCSVRDTQLSGEIFVVKNEEAYFSVARSNVKLYYV